MRKAVVAILGAMLLYTTRFVPQWQNAKVDSSGVAQLFASGKGTVSEGREGEWWQGEERAARVDMQSGNANNEHWLCRRTGGFLFPSLLLPSSVRRRGAQAEAKGTCRDAKTIAKSERAGFSYLDT